VQNAKRKTQNNSVKLKTLSFELLLYILRFVFLVSQG